MEKIQKFNQHNPEMTLSYICMFLCSQTCSTNIQRALYHNWMLQSSALQVY
jgi:hypothetical protein